MVFENLTMNLSALNSIEQLNISIDTTNIFTDIITSANAYTNDYLILVIMTLISIILYITLTDKTPLSDFQYNDLRGLSVALIISSMIGLKIVAIGWSGAFIYVGMYYVLSLLSVILVLIFDNPE